jgi:hypothetical protein
MTLVERWIFVKRSVSYATGERLRPELVTNVPTLLRFAQQEIGVDLPVSNGRRQGFMKFCKDEMEVQGWDIQDLVAAVQFIKVKHKPCRTPQGILWYVSDAKKWRDSRAAFEDDQDLHLKVAAALESETDESWARRLSLAQGKALELVYQNWVAERSDVCAAT